MDLQPCVTPETVDAPVVTLDITSLYRDCHRRAYAIAWAYLKDEEEAHDAVQEAFIKVYRAQDTFNGRSSPQTWLSRIVVNVCLDIRRHKSRRPELQLDDVEVCDPTPRAGDCPERGLEDRELREVITAGLDRLNAAHREIIILREMTGLNYEQIAEREGCPKGTVMSRLFHARRLLRNVLGRKLGGSYKALAACPQGRNRSTRAVTPTPVVRAPARPRAPRRNAGTAPAAGTARR